MGSRDQIEVLSMCAGIQPPSLEDFKSWATSMSSQDTAAGGVWSLKGTQVSSFSGFRSRKRLPMPYKMQQLVSSR